MPQIAHRPAVFDDQERNPFGTVLCRQYPYPETQARVSTIQKNAVEAFFVAGYDFIVGDVAQESPHGLIVHWNGKTEEDAWSARRRIEPPLAFESPAATAVG